MIGEIILRDLMNEPFASIYGIYGPIIQSTGWSTYPQSREGRRMPARIRGDFIRWGRLCSEKATAEEVRLWSGHAACDNVAVAFGPASGGTFAIDIDVTDLGRSLDIEEMAATYLGESIFRRVGMAPKIALIYRHGSADGERVASCSKRLRDYPEDGVEILGAGKSITVHGLHHKTGCNFTWMQGNPIIDGPSAARLVRPHQVRAFLDAVDDRYGFLGAPDGRAPSSEAWDPADAAGIHMPKMSSGAWVTDSDGRVIDGRWAYLSALVARTVVRNVRADNSGDRQKAARICAAVEAKFLATAAPSPRWSGNALTAAIASDVDRFCQRISSSNNQS